MKEETASELRAQRQHVLEVTLESQCELASNAPAVTFLTNNFPQCRRRFDNMFNRRLGKGPVLSSHPDVPLDEEGYADLPDEIDLLEVGFDCSGNSTRSRKKQKLDLRWEVAWDSSAHVSSRTLMCALWILRWRVVRSMRVENVGGCDFAVVMKFVYEQFGGRYTCGVFSLEARDFGDVTARRRQFLLIVLTPCLTSPFSEWVPKLAACVVPQNPLADGPMSRILLSDEDPGVQQDRGVTAWGPMGAPSPRLSGNRRRGGLLTQALWAHGLCGRAQIASGCKFTRAQFRPGEFAPGRNAKIE